MELLTEFTGWPAGTDARAPLLGSLRTGTPVVSIVSIGGVGKTTAILAYAQAAARVNRVQAVRHNVTALDQLHNDLVRGGGIFVPTPSLGERRSLAAAAFTTSAAPFTDATDRPWASFADLSLLDHLIALGRVKYIDDDLPEPSPRGSDWLDGCVMAINKALLPAYRQGLLRFINGIRTILRLILVRVLSALSQCPDTINAVLVLLAASRRHGLRSEPSDYTLPVLTPKSVVIGETARLCFSRTPPFGNGDRPRGYLGFIFIAAVVAVFVLYTGIALWATLRACDPEQRQIRYQIFHDLLDLFRRGRRK